MNELLIKANPESLVFLIGSFFQVVLFLLTQERDFFLNGTLQITLYKVSTMVSTFVNLYGEVLDGRLGCIRGFF